MADGEDRQRRLRRATAISAAGCKAGSARDCTTAAEVVIGEQPDPQAQARAVGLYDRACELGDREGCVGACDRIHREPACAWLVEHEALPRRSPQQFGIDPHPALARSYYRIVSKDGVEAALVPRPDTELAAGCTTERDLGIIARKYRLCDVVVSGAEFVERVNHLTMADALAVKRMLERALRFCARDDAGVVEPEPLEVDVAELCRKSGRSGLSAGLCRYFWRAVHTLEWRTFSYEDNRLLAGGLNELYGINSAAPPCAP